MSLRRRVFGKDHPVSPAINQTTKNEVAKKNAEEGVHTTPASCCQKIVAQGLQMAGVQTTNRVTVSEAIKIWKKLVVIVSPRYGAMTLAIVALIIKALADIARPYLLGQCMDIASSNPDRREEMPWLFGAIAGSHILAGLGQGLKAYVAHTLGEETTAAVSTYAFRHVHTFEQGYFDTHHTSETENALNSLHNVEWIIGHMFPESIATIISLISVCFYLASSGALTFTLLLPMLFFMGLQIVAERWFMRQLRSNRKEKNEAQRAVQKNRMESLWSIRTVKSFSCEEYQSQKFQDMVDLKTKAATTLATFWGLRQWYTNSMMGAAISIVWFLGLRQVMANELTLGELSACCVLIAKLKDSFAHMLDQVKVITEKFDALIPGMQLLNRASLLPCAGGLLVSSIQPLSGELEFKEVKFAYPSRPDELVLNSVSFRLAPGTVTAIVGSSGAGKSTIASLVLRLYDPCSGQVYLDGVPLSSLDLSSFHSLTSIVSQEPVLFSTTIEDNIRFGCKRNDVSFEDIEGAARSANAHSFIMEFKLGYQTIVGERGSLLSAGQKQRIAIARAVLQNPQILILDEATSALDAESEYLVQNALERVMVGRTTLVIAHRLSTVRNADKILVMMGGNIVEEGSHARLLENDGVYAKLVARQLGLVDNLNQQT
jgi:ABC-type multidrug transport system fused ATPase/permease subunit